VSDAQLNVLNYALLALIYLFFARVLWAVWSEVRGPRPGTRAGAMPRGAAVDPTALASRPATQPAPPPGKGPRAKRGIPTRLLVLQPRVRKGAAYPITNDMTLGRAGTCTIGLPDDTFASQLHARLFVRDGQVWLEDLGSTNGTHLNGGRVNGAVQLAKGDRVQVGNTLFEAD
jgi:hypothetical protein